MGVEGETEDEDIINLRLQQRRNFFATLMLSLGVPMISGGDEVGRTQKGNNNAYCQDNEISWTNWDFNEKRKGVSLICSKACSHKNLTGSAAAPEVF